VNGLRPAPSAIEDEENLNSKQEYRILKDSGEWHKEWQY